METLIQGNPSYNEIMHTRGTPRTYKDGNHLQSEINYTRDPLIYGNSCKVKALFNKGAHPRPSLLDESNAHMYMSKAIGTNKPRNQNNQRGQGNNYQKPSRKQNKQKTQLSDPCRPKWTWV